MPKGALHSTKLVTRAAMQHDVWVNRIGNFGDPAAHGEVNSKVGLDSYGSLRTEDTVILIHGEICDGDTIDQEGT